MSNSKNFMSIRSKLLAAIAMFLVASFMVVSSTYAWFTLSTAPEVTGITTQIGANGNLEIALNTDAGIINYPGNSFTGDKNTTWGNIIELAEGYGLNTITLKPSVLSVGTNEDGNYIVNTQPLITPVYGSDGRVSSLSKNSFYGAWDDQGSGFVRDDDGGYGVRALGTVSNMTKQQLQYVTSIAAINSSLTAATSAANTSLKANGAKLVELLLKGLTGDAATTFNVVADTATGKVNELAPLGNMINSLTEVPEKLETALKNYLLVLLSKSNELATDADFANIISAFNTYWGDIFTALQEADPAEETVDVPVSTDLISSGKLTVPVDGKMRSIITAYNSISDRLFNEETGAKTKYDAIVAAGAPVTFETVKGVLTPLMNISSIIINQKSYAEISAMSTKDKANWATGFLTTGFNISMPAGSGVYADIASVTNNISVSFTAKNLFVSVKLDPNDEEPFELTVPELDITMATTLKPAEINKIDTKILPEPADKAADSTAVISDTYAYVLDFAFRTNAANSNLLLQQSAKDRIYGSAENGAANTNSQTMGGGSFMEFKTATGFGEDSVIALMDNLRLVFVNTDTKEILAVGGLDTTDVDSDGATVKAEVVLYEYELDTVDGSTETTIKIATTTTGTTVTKNVKEEQSITALGQNQITNISVYVYLDGESVTNASVPAGADISGNLNLQFASDADLKPMDYADLKPQTTPNA